MPRIAGCNDRQTSFLRAFRQNPAGPDPKNWPTPALLRRWLRRPRFLAALQSIQSTLRFQSDFLLTSAATTAFRKIETSSPEESKHHFNLLRLSHLRQRFESTTPAPLQNEPIPKDPPPPTPPPFIRPEDRLTDAEFQQLAFRRHYASPLEKRPDFPPPTPQDTFYYQLLQDPSALLWWMQLYDEQGRDHRFQPILMNCHRLLPTQRPDKHLPRFSTPSTPDNGDNGGTHP